MSNSVTFRSPIVVARHDLCHGAVFRFNPIRVLVSVLVCWISAHAQEATHWTWTGWGGGGFFWAAEFDPVDANTLYLAGDVAGLYKSTDCARSWRMINAGIQNYAVYALAIAPSNPRTLYAMTVDGMARSDDAGATWTPLNDTRKSAKNISATRSSTVRAIAVDPRNPSIVYAGSGSGALFTSTDAGETWTSIAFSDAHDNAAIASVVMADDALFVAHRKQGLFRSIDGGKNWTQLETPRNASHIAVRGSRAVGAFAKDGVWTSDDAGVTWRPCSGELPAGLDIREVVIDPRDPQTFHFIAQENWNGFHGVTGDGGATWTLTRDFTRDALSNPTLPASFGRDARMSRTSSLALASAAPDTLFIAGNWNNLFSGDGGVSWQQRDHGTDITCFTDVRFAGNAVFATAMDEGLFRSDDNGKTWTHLFPRVYKEGRNGHQWRVLPLQKPDGAFRILSTATPWRGRREYPNVVLISEDSGATFSDATGLPDVLPKVNTMWGEGYARALVEDAKSKAFYLGIDGEPGGGIFKSTDGARTWSRLPNQPGSLRMFYGLAVDPHDSKTIYWGACGDNAGVWRTQDAGESWERTPLTEWIFNLETTPSGTLYAGGNNLWQSRDRATSWRQLTHFSGRSVVGIAVDPEDENRIWVALRSWGTSSAGGVWSSRDGGETWRDITGDLPYQKPLVLRYNSATRELWAAGTAIFKIQQ